MVNFTVSRLAGNALADVVDEGRQISLTNGQFNDKFERNAVHIYKISKGQARLKGSALFISFIPQPFVNTGMVKTKIGRTKKRDSKSIADVVKHKICCGCGACSVVCPNSCISMFYGQRYNFPVLNVDACMNCSLCLKVCPSAFLLKETDIGVFNDPSRGNWIVFLFTQGMRIFA